MCITVLVYDIELQMFFAIQSIALHYTSFVFSLICNVKMVCDNNNNNNNNTGTSTSYDLCDMLAATQLLIASSNIHVSKSGMTEY